MKIDPLLLTAGLILTGTLACNRDQVQTARVEKTAPTTVPPGHPPTDAPPPAAAPAEAPPAPQGPSLAWSLPKGWSTGQAGGMRFATLKPAPTGNVEVSVVVLGGPAGGELANVNRWRAQLQLPPIEEAGLASARKVVQAKAGSVAVYEFSNAGNRMVVGLLVTPDGNTWFLKLMGEDAPVSQARADFMKLLGTLTLG